ncbi:MAG: hypothetical protein H6Q72_2716 [Firmicutes bacterium]|nr:hypothetical protein [Bacillota bacterium]
MSGKQGEAGSKALDNYRKERQREYLKKLKAVLKNFKEEKIPLVDTELAKLTGISVSSLNRSPYKELVAQYKQEEKVLLSPNGKQEVAELIRENRRLKEEVKTLREMYNRLKKEITYSKELFT